MVKIERRCMAGESQSLMCLMRDTDMFELKGNPVTMTVGRSKKENEVL